MMMIMIAVIMMIIYTGKLIMMVIIINIINDIILTIIEFCGVFTDVHVCSGAQWTPDDAPHTRVALWKYGQLRQPRNSSFETCV